MDHFEKHRKSFDRQFNFVFGFILTFIAVIFTVVIAIYGSIGYIAYKTYQDPTVIGKTAGEIVREFNTSRDK